MSLPALALAAQAMLAPCAIEGVPGEARCGTYRVWENRETRQGRQIDLSIIVLPATPALAADFNALLDRFAKTSPVLTLPAGTRRPATSVTVTRGLFAEAFRNLLYTPENAAQTPKLVRQLLDGDDNGIAETALAGRTVLGGNRLAAGFFLSVSCAEDVPYLAPNARAQAEGTFGGDYRLQQQTAACAVWPRGQVSSAHRQPTRSPIPTLIVSGEFDPVTPPAGGEEVLRGLTNGAHVVMRHNGHPIGNAEACVGSMFASFLERASVAGLDRSCAAAIPARPFQLPSAGQ